ncbi:T9SS type A sorting domain-containing protein [Hymenobacter elongatus]|uniref:T9SS type A sorting domain-containing protein n=1 Tax=Hymenobacter elongatus TaxID=877208 RepID=A0A4Z0PG50_9BACT|nr:T9SS type A sorting domain-containing protein [Hymenobacter elongatus]TGE14070.1 T9SS type A sorting domain-containing protein [Hymenobacter elongatus]
MTFALALATTTVTAQTPVWQGGVQSVATAAPNDDSGAIGQSVATDAANNVYVGGFLNSGQNSGVPAVQTFGSTTLSSTQLQSGFIAKLSPALQWQWAVRATTNQDALGIRLVTPDAAGNVYAAGEAISFGANSNVVTVGTLSRTINSTNTMFVTRLTPTGQPQWIAPVTNADDEGYVIPQTMSVDAVTGNIIVAGSYSGGAATFGTITLPDPSNDRNPRAVFVARLSPTGTWLSAISVVPTLSTTAPNLGLQVRAAAVGPQGQVTVAGTLQDASATFGTSTLTAATGSGTKLFVAQLNAANQWQWVATSTGAPASQALGVAYDRSGSLWVSGSAAAGTVLGSTTISTASPFVARLSAAGQWSTVGTASGGLTFGNITTDQAGNALVTGRLTSTISQLYTFGSLSFTATGRRSFVARFSTVGQWEYALPAPAINAGATTYYLSSPVLDQLGNLYTTGYFQGSLTLGSTTLTGHTSSTTFSGDVVVARLASAGVLSTRKITDLQPVALWPNPTTAAAGATLRLITPASQLLLVQLFDAVGRQVRHTSLKAGQQETTLPTAGLAPGLYTLRCGQSLEQLMVE